MGRPTTLRNAHRAAGSPIQSPPPIEVPGQSCARAAATPAGGGGSAARGSRGSCLALWKKSDIRAALYRQFTPARRKAPEYPEIRPVESGSLDVLSWALAMYRIEEKHGSRLIGQNVAIDMDPLQAAWCQMVQDRMSGQGDVFFTGTYSDEYGYAHGLMLSRNIIKDFERFLTSQGLETHNWVCAVEKHKYRDILHLHALISSVGDTAQHIAIEQAWRQSKRGRQVTAAPLADRGYAYCTKYALKGENSADFEWSWTQ